MKLPQAAPGEGVKVEYEHFCNWTVKGGERHTAYLAGDAQWFVAHPSDRGTKPCTHWMTSATVPCRFCALHKTPQTIGYVPVWREVDWRPMLVIVYEEEREHIEHLELHDRVQIGREKELGARIWVRKCMNQEPRFNTTVARRKCKQDITRALLTIWKMPELVAWFSCRAVSDTAVSLDKSAPVPPAPVPPAEAQIYTPPAGDGAAQAADYTGVVNRIKDRTRGLKPSANGRHDKE